MNKVINLHIYDCKINFIISNDISKEIKRISKKHKENFTLDSYVEGIVFYFNISEYFIIINDIYLKHNTLAHEIYHLVNKITINRDITDEEAQAWLCGNLTEIIYTYLKQNKIIVR
jgi:hypothetical protein